MWARGLRRRLEELLFHDADAERLVFAAMRAAAVLPAEGWLERCAAPGATPDQPSEAFLARVHAQALARALHADDPYSLDCAVAPAVEGLAEAAATLGGGVVMFVLFLRETYPTEVVAIGGVALMLVMGVLPYD